MVLNYEDPNQEALIITADMVQQLPFQFRTRILSNGAILRSFQLLSWKNESIKYIKIKIVIKY